MPENTPTRDAKLVQYLNEAYALERRLETALQAHIAEAQKDVLKKRLKEHLKETKAQAKALERRIKQLGGKAEAVDIPGPDALAGAAGVAAAVAQKGLALAKGPAHALRGASPAETQLKNAKTDFSEEHEEIATYNGIEALAEALGDKDTVKLAKEHRRQEERMANFLEKQITQLAKEVARTEVPAAERRAANGSHRRTTRTTRARSGSAGGATTRSTSRSTSSRASAASASGTTRSGGSSASGATRAGSTRSGGSSASGAGRSTSRSTAARKTATTAASSARKTAGSAAKTARTASKAAGTGAKSAAKSGTTSARRSAAASRSTSKRSS